MNTCLDISDGPVLIIFSLGIFLVFSFFNANYFMSIRTFVLMYCSLMMSQIVIILIYFSVYVLYLNYIPPMPFTAMIGYLSLYISLVLLWFSIPLEKRNETKQRRQYLVYVTYKLLNSFVVLWYSLLIYNSQFCSRKLR